MYFLRYVGDVSEINCIDLNLIFSSNKEHFILFLNAFYMKILTIFNFYQSVKTKGHIEISDAKIFHWCLILLQIL